MKLNNLVEMLLNSIQKYGNMEFQFYKKDGSFVPITYKEFGEDVAKISAGLEKLGVKKGKHVGLISDNRREWMLCSFSILSLGCADVPRGCDSTADELKYILKHSDAVGVFLENEEQYEKLKSVKRSISNIKFFIIIDEKFTKTSKFKHLYSLNSVREMGEKALKGKKEYLRKKAEKIKRTDLASIIYTSGTTGKPKGVMLSHGNILQNTEVLPRDFLMVPGEKWLSILPPWHIYERQMQMLITVSGCSISYTNPRELGKDMLLVKPNLMAAIPRVWEAIYEKAITAVKKKGDIAFKIFSFLLRVAFIYRINKKIITNEVPLYSKPNPLTTALYKLKARLVMLLIYPMFLVADKKLELIREKTGGKFRVLNSGGGALQKHVNEFYLAIGLQIHEGYGLTETSPVLAARNPISSIMYTVGHPISGVNIEIRDEQGNIMPPCKQGIIFAKGENIMQGYYKNKEATDKVLSKDGWFNTGDLGILTYNNALQITGRAKDTIVLLGGENVEPVPIENKLLSSPYIEQVLIVGQDRKYLTALVYPSKERVIEFIKKKHHRNLSDIEVLNDNLTYNLILSEVKSLISKEKGFKAFERIVDVYILKEAFRPGHELTHTYKPKRNYIFELFKDEIEKLYNK